MPAIACADTAGATRRRASSNGTPFWFTSYIGGNRYTRIEGEPEPAPDAIYPMAFLVEQDPDCTVGAHYHQADQFQVIVAGGGQLGRHDVTPVGLHFASAYSAYGPLRAGAQGLHYFTLRNGWDPGARYMEFPENRATLRTVLRVHRESVGDAFGLSVTSDDGLAARRHRLGAGQSVVGAEPALGRGQFWLVLAGSLGSGGQVLTERSCAFVYPDEPAFTGVAGPDGADVLAMQFPRR